SKLARQRIAHLSFGSAIAIASKRSKRRLDLISDPGRIKLISSSLSSHQRVEAKTRSISSKERRKRISRCRFASDRSSPTRFAATLLAGAPSVPISLETLSSNSLMSRAKEVFNVSRLVIIKARESITYQGGSGGQNETRAP